MAGQTFDVVVVGSGAGAASLLVRLVGGGSNPRVCVLERGADITLPTAPAESNRGIGSVPPLELPNTMLDAEGRPSAPFGIEGTGPGGGTLIYTGNVLRFSPGDFHRRRTLGEVSGAQLADWPLGYDELQPYYDELEVELGVGGDASANPFEPPRRGPYPAPPIAPDRAGQIAAAAARGLGWHPFPMPSVATPEHGRAPCARCGLCTAHPCAANARWSARPDLLDAAARGRIDLRLQATAVRVLVDEGGARATGVEYLDENGALHVVHGATIVLAANAIQTPRLLLHSTSRHHRDGLGNDSGQVGRNMMTHVMDDFLTVGHVPGVDTLGAAGCTLGIQDFYDTAKTGVPSSITFEPRAMGAFGSFSNLVRQDPTWAALGSADPAAMRARFRGNVVVLTMMEDLPRAENRVRLDDRIRDRFGLPVPVVDYAPHPFDLTTARFASQKARELLDAAGARDVVSLPARTARFHLMGTCRMGDDPRHSVVDRDGRSHRVRNLFIADSSLFVTSAGVNPSLTVQALARRVADRLAA